MAEDWLRNSGEKMLADWQIMILDQAHWLLPVMGVFALAVFPWKHWNSLIN